MRIWAHRGEEEWLLPAGETLFQEGQHAEHFFVLLVEIVVRRNMVTKNSSCHVDPVFFGEIPLLPAGLTCRPHAE
jgi:hypothetical protein